MKNILLFFSCLVLGFNLYSCQKDEAVPVTADNEGVILGGQVFQASDRGTNTASLSWTAAGSNKAEVFFEVYEYPFASPAVLLYSYTWTGTGNSNGSVTSPGFTTGAGKQVYVQLRSRKAISTSPNFALTYTFGSSCGFSAGSGWYGGETVFESPTTPWASIGGYGALSDTCP